MFEAYDARAVRISEGLYIVRVDVNGGRVALPYRPNDRHESALLDQSLRAAMPITAEVAVGRILRVRSRN